MSIVRILTGLPGSGKTTYAKEIEKEENFIRITKDEYMRTKFKVPFYEYIEKYVKDGKDVVVDTSNVSRMERETIENIAKRYEAKIEICVFDVPMDICIERNRNKPLKERADEKTLRELFDRFEYPTEDECDSIIVINQ